DSLAKRGVVVRGDIGVLAQTITPALASGLDLPAKSGVIIVDVAPGHTGSRAGLRPGDIVLSLNGQDLEDARQFQAILFQQEPMGMITLELLRDQKPLTKHVKVSARADGTDRLSMLVDERQQLVERLAILGL